MHSAMDTALVCRAEDQGSDQEKTKEDFLLGKKSNMWSYPLGYPTMCSLFPNGLFLRELKVNLLQGKQNRESNMEKSEQRHLWR